MPPSSAPPLPDAPANRWLSRHLPLRNGEAPAVLWAATYFFLLLCSYYVLRPVRDEMAVQAGVRELPWLFTAVFVAMLALVPLFGWLSSRFARRRFLPIVYLIFVTSLGLFWLLFTEKSGVRHATMAFFIWVSVFNLFVVSVFWSFMADLFSTEQARRLYGLIAAGGTAGAIAGPTLSALLAAPLGPVNLLLVSAGLLLAAVLCIQRLGRWAVTRGSVARDRAEEPIGGSIWSGIHLVARSPYLLGICLYVVLYTMTSTSLYFQQVEIVPQALSTPEERTRLFAAADLAVNIITLALQVLVFRRFIAKLGLAAGLVVVPIFSLLGFAVLGLYPTLAVLMVFGVLRRAGEFAIAKPSRETLFNLLSREEKYKPKNFMDTVVYRGGDSASSWLFAALKAAGFGMSAVAYLAVPVAALWAWNGMWLARRHARLRTALDTRQDAASGAS
jgi:AAA family ATP:ADP antiporter